MAMHRYGWIAKKTSPTKIFLAPQFTPKMMQVRIADGKAVANHAIALNDQQGQINGLPLPAGLIGSTSETALSDALKPVAEHSERGLDTEGLVSDGQDGFWLCDEYGPFLIMSMRKEKFWRNSGRVQMKMKRRRIWFA